MNKQTGARAHTHTQKQVHSTKIRELGVLCYSRDKIVIFGSVEWTLLVRSNTGRSTLNWVADLGGGPYIMEVLVEGRCSSRVDSHRLVECCFIYE